jgi:hypothetical protein
MWLKFPKTDQKWNFSIFLKKTKLVEGGTMTYLNFLYFLNQHALGYPKSVTILFCEHVWVNKSLSMMCTANYQITTKKKVGR